MIKILITLTLLTFAQMISPDLFWGIIMSEITSSICGLIIVCILDYTVVKVARIVVAK